MINAYTNVEYFFGVVEDRDDPKMLGRVRVRVFGLHPFEKEQGDFSGLPTEELPWMHVIQPPTSPSVGGIGQAPVGPLPGTHVVGLFLDKYKINGMVIGTYYGDQVDFGVEGEGFRDATETYPGRAGNGTPDTSQGGVVGGKAASVVMQSNTGSIGINPNADLGDFSNIEDDNPGLDLETMLKRDEGVVLNVYKDSLGYPTIGIGHLLTTQSGLSNAQINNIISKEVGRTVTNGRITMDEAMMLFRRDIKITKSQMRSNSTIGPVYAKMNASRRMALENMGFQLGVSGLAKFKNTLAYLGSEDYESAYTNVRKSLWAKQTPGRANRVSLILKNGNLESYGVMVDKKKTRMVSTFNEESVKDKAKSIWDEFIPLPTPPQVDLEQLREEPEAPFEEEDSRVMFTEPQSAYQGEYPYVQTITTEGGHTTEYDNIPGKERFKYQHPSGSYTEIDGLGRSVTRVVDENYNIYKSHNYTLVEGDNKASVNGNNKEYIMGESDITVDGQDKKLVRGDIILEGAQNLLITIEADSTVTIKGASLINVEDDSEVNIKGNSVINITGDATTNITGSFVQEVHGDMKTVVHGKREDVVSGGWERTTTGNVVDTASDSFTIDGSRVELGL